MGDGGDFLKKPYGGSANTLAIQRANDAIQKSGKSLPCSIVEIVSSGIVTVNFEVNTPTFTLPQVTVPVNMSRYARLPLQVGDKGYCASADARLGGITGLGSGVAGLDQPGNLSALVFEPLGQTTWDAVDLNAFFATGPNGFVLQDDSNATSIIGTPPMLTITRGDGTVVMNGSSIVLTQGGTSITLDGTNVDIVGVLMINGQPYLGHMHSGVQSGSDPSGPVVP